MGTSIGTDAVYDSSNRGAFGSLPIINLPQAAVFGMQAIKYKPIVVSGRVIVRPTMVVALTYDHQLMHGREALTSLVSSPTYVAMTSNISTFCYTVRIKENIEDPRVILSGAMKTLDPEQEH